MDLGLPYLRETLVFLLAMGIAMPILHRLRIPAMLGLLVVGVAIGPYGVARLAAPDSAVHWLTIEDGAGLRALAELGVVFLLFMIGLELAPRRLWEMRRLVFGLGTAQWVVTAALLAAIIAAAGIDPAVAVVLGACLAFSSTAMVARILHDRRALAGALGRASLGILLLQDLAVVPTLVLVGILGSGEAAIASAMVQALGKALVAVVAIGVIGRFALGPLYRLAAATRSRETFMAMTLLVVLATAALTHAAGLSMALGAFLAGLVIADSEHRHEIEIDLEPFKGLLLGLFFMTVGMGIDLAVIAERPVAIALSFLGLLALKAAIIIALALAFGLPQRVALEAGLLLAQAGEFAFIVVALASATLPIERDLAQAVLLVVGLTMLATPVIALVAGRLARAPTPGARVTDLAVELSGHVIIAGFGRVGRTIADLLDAEQVPWIAIDRDPDSARQAPGRIVVIGQADRGEMLRRAGAERAQALVITLDDMVAARRAIDAAHRRFPALRVYVRARDGAAARALAQGGAAIAVPETIESSLQLGGHVLAGLGASDEVVARRVTEAREALRHRDR